MLPSELNEKFNINYDGEVYLRYSLSSEVNDHNPLLVNRSRSIDSVRIKNKDSWENYGLDDIGKAKELYLVYGIGVSILENITLGTFCS